MCACGATNAAGRLSSSSGGRGSGWGAAIRNLIDTPAYQNRPVLAGALKATISGGSVRVQAQPPLELRGPFPGASYLLRNTTAGVLGGDAYEVDVTAEAGSTVRIGSSSATKVYAGSGGASSMTSRLAVESGATLLWGPHATVVQTGSIHRQAMTLEVAEGGRAVLGEVLMLGRVARGERFDFERLESRLEVRICGARVYDEAYSLTPGSDLIAGMAGRGVLASVYGIGLEADPELGCALAGEALAGWSELPNGAGLVVRGLCDSLSSGKALVDAVMRLLAAREVL